MNESMNFGNIGFNEVPVENKEEVVAEQNPATTISNEEIKEEVKEEKQEEIKEEPKEEKADGSDKEAIEDFKNAKVSEKSKSDDNFSSIDFGPLQKYLDDDDVTDISYSNGGQLWLKSLSKGVYRSDQQDVNNALIEKIAFQCSNVMGKTFNMAHPFLDSESAELRMNFVHDSIARNGIACVFRKTPAKIRLEKQKLLNEKYITLSIHDFLINCVKGHCNIIVCGETGSGKTELVKYLASHTAENEKLITIEDTLELHLDRIYPTRDIVAMKTNNIASYSDVLVTCMRQNPKWILLSEVRSAEAVTAVRNSISSGHYILSTIHADKAESIPHRMYSLLESNIDVEQFLKTIYRYVQIGVFVRGRYDPREKRFVREIAGVTEFYVTDDTQEPMFNNIYKKTVTGEETFNEPTKYLKAYLEGQGIDINNLFGENKASLIEANEINARQMSENSNIEPEQKEEPTNEEPPKENTNEEIVQELEVNDIQEITNSSVQEDVMSINKDEANEIETDKQEALIAPVEQEINQTVEQACEPKIDVQNQAEQIIVPTPEIVSEDKTEQQVLQNPVQQLEIPTIDSNTEVVSENQNTIQTQIEQQAIPQTENNAEIKTEQSNNVLPNIILDETSEDQNDIFNDISTSNDDIINIPKIPTMIQDNNVLNMNQMNNQNMMQNSMNMIPNYDLQNNINQNMQMQNNMGQMNQNMMQSNMLNQAMPNMMGQQNIMNQGMMNPQQINIPSGNPNIMGIMNMNMNPMNASNNGMMNMNNQVNMNGFNMYNNQQ